MSSLSSTDTNRGTINPRHIWGNQGAALLSLCEEKKEKTLTCLFVSFKPLSAIPTQWVQVVLPTDGDRQKTKVL